MDLAEAEIEIWIRENGIDAFNTLKDLMWRHQKIACEAAFLDAEIRRQYS